MSDFVRTRQLLTQRASDENREEIADRRENRSDSTKSTVQPPCNIHPEGEAGTSARVDESEYRLTVQYGARIAIAVGHRPQCLTLRHVAGSAAHEHMRSGTFPQSTLAASVAIDEEVPADEVGVGWRVTQLHVRDRECPGTDWALAPRTQRRHLPVEQRVVDGIAGIARPDPVGGQAVVVVARHVARAILRVVARAVVRIWARVSGR
eukprot:2342189-Prymnesium_polylepis.1